MDWREPPQDWREVDRRVGLPSDRQLRALADTIDQMHRKRHGDGDKLVDGHRIMGLMGERHIARHLELKMDLTVTPYGNARKNFVLSTGATVDVMTRSPLSSGRYPDLTRKVKARGRPDILILVVWHGFSIEPEIGGWILEKDLMQHGDIRTFRQDVPNRVLPIGSLHPFYTLMQQHNPDSPFADESFWRSSSIHTEVITIPNADPKEEVRQIPLF